MMCSYKQHARRARFRSQIRTRSSQSTQLMIAPGSGYGLVKISFGTACCDRIDPRGYPPERRFKADPDE